MPDATEVLVVGAGLAGMAAACTLAEHGMRVLLVEQAPVWGGAVMRQPATGLDPRLRGPHQSVWERLVQRRRRQRALLSVRCGVQYSGLDADGAALLVELGQSTHFLARPRAVVIATGASERVRPRPGWQLAGVMTAGAIQVGMKTRSLAPVGRVLLGGSGPLLLAVGAQMVRMGNPPIAIVEAANPLARWHHAWPLPLAYWREAAGYAWTLQRARVPMVAGAQLRAIEQVDTGLRVEVATVRGSKTWHEADLVGLHDGIEPDVYGPAAPASVMVRRAGDCHEALGARAAAHHGERIAHELASALRGLPEPATAPTGVLAREQRAQAVLRRIFQHDEKAPLHSLPDDTIVCRCERRTLRDLRSLGPEPSAREIRLLGRFCMGACQGRFCAPWVRQLAGTGDTAALRDLDLMGSHWPAKPVSIRALVTESPPTGDDQPYRD